jgi:hypothetical protein
LGSDGCIWKVTPLVCAMFVCDQAQADAINQNPMLIDLGTGIGNRRRRFAGRTGPYCLISWKRCSSIWGVNLR